MILLRHNFCINTSNHRHMNRVRIQYKFCKVKNDPLASCIWFKIEILANLMVRYGNKNHYFIYKEYCIAIHAYYSPLQYVISIILVKNTIHYFKLQWCIDNVLSRLYFKKNKWNISTILFLISMFYFYILIYKYVHDWYEK